MKKLIAVLACIAVMLCCTVSVCAVGSYTFVAPEGLISLGEKGNMKLWASSDYTSLLMLITEENDTGILLSECMPENTDEVNDFLGSDITDIFNIQSYDTKQRFADQDCLKIACSIKPSKESKSLLGSTYKYNMYVFTSDETMYTFIFGTSGTGKYTSADFEKSLHSLKISDTTSAESFSKAPPKTDITEAPTEELTEADFGDYFEESVFPTDPSDDYEDIEDPSIAEDDEFEETEEVSEYENPIKSFLDKFKLPLLIGGTFLIVLAAVVIALIISKSKKNRNKPQYPPQFDPRQNNNRNNGQR